MGVAADGRSQIEHDRVAPHRGPHRSDSRTVDPPQPIGPITCAGESTATFNLTPSASAAVDTNVKISALLTTGGMTGYTDNVIEIVPPAEGRFHRWGNWAEYDNWLQNTTPQAYRLGRSAAVQSMGIGETLTDPVGVHNWSNVSQSGDVSLALPSDFTADATSKPYGPLAPGGDTQVTFTLTNTDTSLPANQSVTIPITTTFSSPSGSRTAAAQAVGPWTRTPFARAMPPSRTFSSLTETTVSAGRCDPQDGERRRARSPR